MTLSTLRDLLVHELRDLYSAEKQLLKALPRMVRAASSDNLRISIEEHLEQTRGHVTRLEEIFSLLDASSRGAKCDAMEGLIEESSKTLDENAEPAVMDAALIALAQKVEHYEIASYGTVVTFARTLGHSAVENLLQKTLDEEKTTDRTLTELAESEVNAEAQAMGS